MQSGSIASQARVIAPEVASIAFRYFDGAAVADDVGCRLFASLAQGD